MIRQLKKIAALCLLILLLAGKIFSTEISDNTFLIAEINAQNINNERLWNLLARDNNTGIELSIDSSFQNATLIGTNFLFESILEKIYALALSDSSKIIPVFLNYNGDVLLIDSIIHSSPISSGIFYLPQGEAWPTMEYLVQANRRIIFFIDGGFSNESRILHDLKSYALQISANQLTSNTAFLTSNSNLNLELFKVDEFEKLPTVSPPTQQGKNMIPDYVNFLLENWKKYGKKPNFIFVGKNIFNYDFIADQLNSFRWIKGRIRTSGKNLEKVYWKNPDILVTGGMFSFPYRGGEEAILTPFAPGYKMTPEQIIVTAEMPIPENHSILANPMNLSDGMTGSFHFDGIVLDAINPGQSFVGENFSFSQDIERGDVLRLPENASINLGNPETYGLPNSSFTVSCFVKFTDILEFGDNAILGNYETGYSRGMHLVLRSGHPYFGLWSNDFMSEEVLRNNIWHHLTWRYIIETGEQAIFLNGKFIGGSDGHPPYSGTGDIYVGSALSQGASLRGYIDNLYLWDRPLGNEEINRLSLDEDIHFEKTESPVNFISSIWAKALLISLGIVLLLLLIGQAIRKFRTKKEGFQISMPNPEDNNQIQLFGEFRAINRDTTDVTDLFTSKVKELFIFILIYTQKNRIGAPISEINTTLWPGIEKKKIANNRAVTLNKLRKILIQFDKIEVISNTGYLQLKTKEPLFCDYIEAFKLCQIPEGMTQAQLETFFHLVKKGRFLKATNWPWLDEVRGFTGNQVIDNLLKLASVYKKESNLNEIEKIAQRILEYDDLNEEALYFQVWALRKANNPNLAKFNFKSFCNKYEENMGEPFSMDFSTFYQFYSDKL